jgi:hypothetical protein
LKKKGDVLRASSPGKGIWRLTQAGKSASPEPHKLAFADGADFGRADFQKLFEVGEVVTSGGDPNRRNAARLKIVSIDDDAVAYRSITSQTPEKTYRLEYSLMGVLLDKFEAVDPDSIQNSVNAVLKRTGFVSDHVTETYAYGFAKAYRERTDQDLFRSQGELGLLPATDAMLPGYFEGLRSVIQVERIERDPRARKRCIEHYGAECQACGFNFDDVYGKLGRGFIHVHHRRQLAKSKGRRAVDPIRDLEPLCPNCHAMVHMVAPPISSRKLRSLIESRRLNGPGS